MADLPVGSDLSAIRAAGPSDAVSTGFIGVTPAGDRTTVTRAVPVEVPIAIEVNGIGYAVMMATPAALEDFAAGFLLAERLIDAAADIAECEAVSVHRGVLLRVTLAARLRGRIVGRVRHRTSDSACGLCGVENLEQALRPLPVAPPAAPIAPAAVFAALAALPAHQPLGAATRAVHAAALCAADGTVRLVREDVGRHNAFDKLVGAMARGGSGWQEGFALVTSRLSYELVEKAALAGCATIAAISLPTDLALARAAEAGIRVIALARPDALLEAVTPG